MGTSNFYNNNATSIFSLEIEDQLHWDMVFEDLTIQLADDPLTDEDELWLQNAREDLINELEGFYKEVSTPLGVTARASNGTCMYHKK